MNNHITIRVYGKVQGVYFRKYTKEKADELGVKGTVRNLPDGSVFIEAAGTVEQLHLFSEWCRQGPPRARVERLEIKEAGGGDYTAFGIIR